MAIRLGKMKINRLWLLVGMALVLGLLATWLSVTYLRNREEAIQTQLMEKARGGDKVMVVVPTSDLAKGTVLREGIVAGREIAADLAYWDTIPAEDFDKIKGRPLLRDVQRGRPLMRADVVDDRPKEFSATLTKGMRAITVDIDELNSISQMLKAGDFIDLNLISADTSATSGGQQIFPFLQAVKVIATGQRAVGVAEPPPNQQTPESMHYATVTVEVTPEEAGYIALAQQSGRIRVTLRSPEDKAIDPYGPLTVAQLTGGQSRVKAKGGKAAPAPAGVKVEYILGGKAGGGAAPPINITMPGIPGMNSLPGFPGGTSGLPPGVPANAGGVNISSAGGTPAAR
jgi:pilus assembly protein CpaB